MSKCSSAIPVITIDGLSGTGKGTISQLLATRLGWNILDSGALYRAVAWAVLQHQIDADDDDVIVALMQQIIIQMPANPSQELATVICDGIDISLAIRQQDCSTMASKLAAKAAVRSALVSFQHAMRKAPGLIADGRDMGSVIFKDAPLKFYFQATANERARRRCDQLKKQGINVSLREVLQSLAQRDQRDVQRDVAPAIAAPDAIEIDTTDLDIEHVLAQVLIHVQRVFGASVLPSTP